MSDAVVATPAAAPAVASPKKAVATKKAAAKKSAYKSTHPPTGDMVNAAIAALKDKKGSSLQAIKKYIAGTYILDVEKQASYIKNYLKSAVEKKTIVQTKGTGASGRFKLVVRAEVEKKKVVEKPAAKKPVGEKKIAAKTPVDKKLTGEKKVATPKKPSVAKKPKTATKPKAAKSESKVKKSGKALAAAKPKTSKPKFFS